MKVETDRWHERVGVVTPGNAEKRVLRLDVNSPAVYEIELTGSVHAEGGADGLGGLVRERTVIVVDNDFHGSFPAAAQWEAWLPAELAGCRVWAAVIDPGPGNDAGEEPGIGFFVQGKAGMEVQWSVAVDVREGTF